MAKLTPEELKNIQPANSFYDWDNPRLAFPQLEKILTGSIASVIDNYPGHSDTGEGKHILRVSEADICTLVNEAQAAGNGFLREGVTITESNKDLIVQTALGSLVTGWDQPGGKGKPRRYYISEEKLIARLDQVDPNIIKKVEGYGTPSLAAHQMQALIAEAAVVTDFPGHKGRVFRITEHQLAQLNGSARNRDPWGLGGFGFGGSGSAQTTEGKLGELLAGYDGTDGARRYYVTEAAYNRFIGSKPLTHDEIWQLQRTRSDVSGGQPKSGWKEFTASTLTRLLGPTWKTRLEGLWEEAPGTGHEDVAAVNMEALATRMQDEKRDARERERGGFSGGGSHGRYGGGFGRRW